MVVALEAGLHHSGEVAALLTRLVDADTHRTQTGKEQQQVVDEITEASVVVVTDDRTETDTVLTAERMVAHEGVELAVVLVGQVFLTLNRHLHVEVLHAFLEPFRTELMAMLPQEVIDFILMNDATKPRHEEGRHISCAPSQLAFKNLLHVYCLLKRLLDAFSLRVVCANVHVIP